jgi:hypothetical protein
MKMFVSSCIIQLDVVRLKKVLMKNSKLTSNQLVVESLHREEDEDPGD